MFKRVLIANRGEIALRVQRTCRELGIETVAVYSEADRNALHVRHADAAVCIGPGPALESYLAMDRVLDAAKKTGADALHPGYGFLSENADFADACQAADITFIGPTGSAMRAMGDKVAARRLMEEAGVPVVPGANEIDINDLDTARREAERVGFPLLVKASAGGGGRGIRQVDGIDDLEEAMRASGSEAASTFGDATIFFERYVSPARHIEVQIMADAHGNVRTYGERECSVQRRHQKVLEESPSVAVDPDLRQRFCEAAAAAARSCEYRNAGTVEFLMEADGEFYFLEMNARLQVEHPVTELVYGVDLVALQFEVAAGAVLDPQAPKLEPRGWAIEARINGADPYNNFTPSLGLVEHVDVPLGPGIRFDTMLFDGLDVPIYYDSMLGKLIVWAETRDAAIERLRRALKDLVVTGIDTNVPFHLALLDHADFVSGAIDTGWLEREFEMPPPPDPDRRTEAALIAGAIAASMVAGAATSGTGSGGMTKWSSAALAASKRGVQSAGRVSGWRRGIGSE